LHRSVDSLFLLMMRRHTIHRVLQWLWCQSEVMCSECVSCTPPSGSSMLSFIVNVTGFTGLWWAVSGLVFTPSRLCPWPGAAECLDNRLHTATRSSRNVRRHLLCLRIYVYVYVYEILCLCNADDDSSMTCQYVTTQCTGTFAMQTMQQMYHGKGKRGKFLQPFSGT